MFQQMGFGVAVALLIDATIVRSVLVPAAMKLLGGRNRHLPYWLTWLPDVHVEGAEPPQTGLRTVASGSRHGRQSLGGASAASIPDTRRDRR